MKYRYFYGSMDKSDFNQRSYFYWFVKWIVPLSDKDPDMNVRVYWKKDNKPEIVRGFTYSRCLKCIESGLWVEISASEAVLMV